MKEKDNEILDTYKAACDRRAISVAWATAAAGALAPEVATAAGPDTSPVAARAAAIAEADGGGARNEAERRAAVSATRLVKTKPEPDGERGAKRKERTKK